MIKLIAKKCLLIIIHLEIHSKTVCQIKELKLVGNNFFFSVIKPGFYFVLSRRQQILGSVLCFQKEAKIFSGEGSHVVHGACCQGNHALCLYMSRPSASFGDNWTIKSRETENANYDVHAASEKLQGE